MNASLVRSAWTLGLLASLSGLACDAVDHPVGAESQDEALNGDAANVTIGGTATTGAAGASGATEVSEKWSKDIVRECAGGPPDVPITCGNFSENPTLAPYSMVIVLDQSLKMTEPLGSNGQSGWDAVEQGLVNLYRDYTSATGSGVSLVFTGPSDAATSCIIDPRLISTIPAEQVSESIEDTLQLDEPESAARPLAPAFNAAFAHLAVQPSHDMLIVLITAGAPDACAGDDPIAELADLAEGYLTGIPDHRVPTYVIELGSNANLDSVAKAGGTQRAASITGGDVAAQVEQALRNALDGVRFAEHCTFENPFNGVVPSDPILIGPPYEPEVQEAVPRLDGPEACDTSPQGGYYLLEDAAEVTFRYCPCSCARFARLGAHHLLTYPADRCW